MKYKNLLFSGFAFLLSIFYFLYKRSPTIQQSLISDGYKLVSSSDNKEEIYRGILQRNENNINLIVLDPYLIEKDRKWEALSFWCDLETNKNSFLRSLNIYKQFCVMSISDSAIDSNKKRIWEFKSLSESEGFDFQEKIMKIENTSGEKIEEFWENWCNRNSNKPFWKLNLALSDNVFKYCYKD